MIDRIIKGVINKENIIYSILKYAFDLVRDKFRISQSCIFSFNDWVGAINAFEWTTPFCLDISHASPFQVCLIVKSRPIRNRDVIKVFNNCRPGAYQSWLE